MLQSCLFYWNLPVISTFWGIKSACSVLSFGLDISYCQLLFWPLILFRFQGQRVSLSPYRLTNSCSKSLTIIQPVMILFCNLLCRFTSILLEEVNFFDLMLVSTVNIWDETHGFLMRLSKNGNNINAFRTLLEKIFLVKVAYISRTSPVINDPFIKYLKWKSWHWQLWHNLCWQLWSKMSFSLTVDFFTVIETHIPFFIAFLDKTGHLEFVALSEAVHHYPNELSSIVFLVAGLLERKSTEFRKLHLAIYCYYQYFMFYLK